MMGFFRKRCKRTDDERISNLEEIDLDYCSISVRGDSCVSPSELKSRIWMAMRDMGELIEECAGMRARLNGRTCEMVKIETGERADYDCAEAIWHCEACYAELAVYASNEDGDAWAEKPVYCPNCGAKVVEP